MRYNLFVVFFLFVSIISLYAQHKVRVYGYIIDSKKNALEYASIYVEENTKYNTKSNESGYYDLSFESNDSVSVVVSLLGFKPIKFRLGTLEPVQQVSAMLTPLSNEISEVKVEGRKRQSTTMDMIDVKKYRLIPNANGTVESMLVSFAGVSMNNELSSQYNVRGGNFDENIVYVNGIEVYRPLLIRAGQQEGLSFINRDMVNSLSFSSGGFEAKYGDKSASVLDVNYRRPDSLEASVTASLLGSTAYVGTASRTFTQLHGVRYKTAKYLLGTLDTKGEYSPSFFDYQTFLTYKINSKFELSFLGNISQNSFQFIPQDRETSFGTYNTGRNLTVYFEGQEKDLFRTAFAALSLHYKPNAHLNLGLISSVFTTDENESYDILGEYILSEVNMNSAAESTKGEVLGIGKYHEHARNTLNATVASLQHIGEFTSFNHKVIWGASFQVESIKDKISEWEWRDSSGYSLPHSPDRVNLYYNLKNNSTLNTFRTTAYIQDTYKWDTERGLFSVNGGVRTNFWTFNKELLVSPRISCSFLPYWKNDFSFRFATGVYYQAPFYKEIRDTLTDSFGNVQVKLNSDIKAQRSLHFVLGADYYFRAWGRPFKFTTEAYSKLSDRVETYTIDNVRIRYSGKNDARAFTNGLDFKIFGELVPGTDSWLNFSLMNSKEDIIGDSYVHPVYDANAIKIGEKVIYPSWVSRPSEQRYSFSMMFEDYLPNNPKYKLQLTMVFSDGLPFGPTRNQEYRAAYRMPPYRRVDIGVSRKLMSGAGNELRSSCFKHVKSIWLNLELLNLMDFKNVNSYYWVTDIYNQQLAVPNYLTSRQLNLKIIVDLK